LYIPPLKKREGEDELKERFREMHPRLLGVLLDGLVGAIRGWRAVRVEKPARLADFERWAEAGCRAMGFEENEFILAYAANRQGSLEISLAASAVGRAVMAFMEKHREGYVGQMIGLLKKLEPFRRGAASRDWPDNGTKLSSALRRIVGPLSSVGILVEFNVDRRSQGGSQKDISLAWGAAGR
jgi:hypothetical protein